MPKISITPYKGKSRKTNKEYNAYLLTIGDWSSLFFPKSQFERKYLDSIIGEGGIEVDD